MASTIKIANGSPFDSNMRQFIAVRPSERAAGQHSATRAAVGSGRSRYACRSTRMIAVMQRAGRRQWRLSRRGGTQYIEAS